MMIVKTLEVVINTEYGGFSLTKEMAEWLQKEKSWKICADKDLDLNSKEKYDAANREFDLIGWGSYYRETDKWNKIEFRTNAALIECIKFFKKKYKTASYTQRMHNADISAVCSLKIEVVNISLQIEDYDDGKEKIVSYVSNE